MTEQNKAQTTLNILDNKKILLGISGGIAAYKCADLTRHLVKRGVDVRVVMTDAAKEFITPLTIQALSNNPVAESLFASAFEAPINHIELAKWSDLILVAPASADIIARITSGMANDLLSTLILASDAPVAIAPAMNQQMYKAKATQENLATLARREFAIWGPASGEQACGDIGLGRMLEPLELINRIEVHFSTQACSKEKDLKDLSILINAGPTREALDPIRFISNHSSGKMGYALADAAAKRGAKVTLISGPVRLATPQNVSRIDVESAVEMHKAVMKVAHQHNIFIACAAVADFRAKEIAAQKIKKESNNEELGVILVKNPDIVADVANMQEYRPFTVGFAAETRNLAHYAKKKLKYKNLDLICANDVSAKEYGFESDFNALHLYWQNGEKTLAKATKTLLADQVISEIFILYHKNKMRG